MEINIGLCVLIVNGDIFACIHFRGSTKMGNFALIDICILRINGSVGYHEFFFFMVYIFSRIFKKLELCENMFNAKISTFTVFVFVRHGEGCLYI